MKLIISVLMAVTLSACASNNSFYHGTPSISTSTSTSIPIKDAVGNEIGRIYQSVHVSSYGVSASTYTSLWNLLGTDTDVSFNISW